jgi:hypothetical protein
MRKISNVATILITSFVTAPTFESLLTEITDEAHREARA